MIKIIINKKEMHNYERRHKMTKHASWTLLHLEEKKEGKEREKNRKEERESKRERERSKLLRENTI
ncbi:MAG: hypothetical protein Q8881_02205 [Sweet potato little leaf phytoplasma]|nr:hypothetical protein [Sweet potato little leaf phytoplasma]